MVFRVVVGPILCRRRGKFAEARIGELTVQGKSSVHMGMQLTSDIGGLRGELENYSHLSGLMGSPSKIAVGRGDKALPV